MSELAREQPREYPKGTPPLSADEAAELARDVPGWEVQEGKLVRVLTFKNFNETIGFVARVALVAEAKGHHPDMFISWNRLELTFWTHTAEGLTRNDFIMAARIDRMLGEG